MIKVTPKTGKRRRHRGRGRKREGGRDREREMDCHIFYLEKFGKGMMV